MTNSDILDVIEMTGKIMEMHDGDPNRVRSFQNVGFSLGKVLDPFVDMSDADLLKLQGVGKGLVAAIREIQSTGTLQELQDLLASTPEGLLDLFKIKGLGVKKIKILWKELGLDNLNDLQIACENGLIAQVKGFGVKTQDSILSSLAFLQSQAGKMRMNKAHEVSQDILEALQPLFPHIQCVGEIAQADEVVQCIQLAYPTEDRLPIAISLPNFTPDPAGCAPFVWRGRYADHQIAVEVHAIPTEKWIPSRLMLTAKYAHLVKPVGGKSLLQVIHEFPNLPSEEAFYQKLEVPYIIPEMREGRREFSWAMQHHQDELVSWESLKGVLHNHSTYSDGRHSLSEMATFAESLGWEYFGIADHSQTAAYAQGLGVERVHQQWIEIDTWNQQPDRIRILKGIESDILLDGSLDYPDEILSGFDYVVASVHQTLQMDVVRATDRLIKAISHPATTILGHPTGRLLLSRKGYPIHHKEVIAACAAYGVVIELNASPYRLDVDWRWIDECLDQGVMISINPDAHEQEGFFDMKYGVMVARKAGLTQDKTFNAQALDFVMSFKK